VSTFLAEIREIVLPAPGGRHGPLPPLLLAMTMVTGLVDAFSYLLLGHVFVANMTGNVVILGFALVGAPGFSITASLSAIVAFAAGALAGGRVGSRLAHHRGHLFAVAGSIQAVFLLTGVILAAITVMPIPDGFRYSLIAVLAVAMGIQNACARRLAVPDLTTTVLTLTITGFAADSTLAGGRGSRAGRRLIAVAVMLVGAVIGAAFVLHRLVAIPLVIAFGLTTIAAATSWLLGRQDAPWLHADA
jgi:uncharacterized membrane protein YoaK (UPF0700 family)